MSARSPSLRSKASGAIARGAGPRIQRPRAAETLKTALAAVRDSVCAPDPFVLEAFKRKFEEINERLQAAGGAAVRPGAKSTAPPAENDCSGSGWTPA